MGFLGAFITLKGKSTMNLNKTPSHSNYDSKEQLDKLLDMAIYISALSEFSEEVLGSKIPTPVTDGFRSLYMTNKFLTLFSKPAINYLSLGHRLEGEFITIHNRLIKEYYPTLLEFVEEIHLRRPWNRKAAEHHQMLTYIHPNDEEYQKYDEATIALIKVTCAILNKIGIVIDIPEQTLRNNAHMFDYIKLVLASVHKNFFPDHPDLYEGIVIDNPMAAKAIEDIRSNYSH